MRLDRNTEGIIMDKRREGHDGNKKEGQQLDSVL